MVQTLADALTRVPMSRPLGDTFARAQRYAREQSHRRMTLEHLLLALSEDQDAAPVLQACQVDVARLTMDASDFVGRLEERFAPGEGGEPNLDPELLRILDYAGAAAQQSKRRDINGAIVLAAIVGEGRSTAAQLLRAQGLTFEETIRALQKTVAARPAPPRQVEPPPVAEAAGAPAVPKAAPPRPAAAQTPEQVLATVRDRISSGRTQSPQTSPRAAAAPENDGAAPPAQTAQLPAPSMSPPNTVAIQRQPPDLPPPSPPPPREQVPPREPARDIREVPWEAQREFPPPLSPPNPQAAPPRLPPSPADVRAAPTPPGAPPPSFPPTDGAPRNWSPPPQPAPRPDQRQDQRPDHRPDQRPSPRAIEPLSPLPPPQPQLSRPPRRPPQPPPPWPDGPPANGQPHPMAASPSPPPWPRPSAGPVAEGAPARGPAMPPPMPNPTLPSASGRAPAPTPQTNLQPAPVQPRRGTVDAGHLVENIPRRMTAGVSEIVEVRIARGELESLAFGMEGRGTPVRHDLVVTRAMSVKLKAVDGGFWIEASSPETQWVESRPGLMVDDFATWRWTVMPERRGRTRLQLVVAARTVSADGLTAETALPEQTVEVRVSVNYGRTIARWSGWAVAAILGGALAHFGQSALELGMKLING